MQGCLRYFFKRVFRAEPNAFSADNTFCVVNRGEGADVPLSNGVFRTNRDGRARVILRTFLRIYDNFHIVAPLSDLQYCSLIDAIRAMTRSSRIQYITLSLIHIYALHFDADRKHLHNFVAVERNGCDAGRCAVNRCALGVPACSGGGSTDGDRCV